MSVEVIVMKDSVQKTGQGLMQGNGLQPQIPMDGPTPLPDGPGLGVDPASGMEPLPGLLERAQSLLEIGGPVVTILVMMSFVALLIVVMKLIQFRALRIGNIRPARRAVSAWRSGDREQALEHLDGCFNPVARVVAQAIHGRQSALPEERVREEVLRCGSDILFQLRRGFRPLEVIGSLAPLLGLLGTVLGMIKAFQQLEAAGNQVNPAILSGGIWEALLTTAVGLCVAIPAVAMLNWLERRIDHLAHEMDNLVTQIFTEELSQPVAVKQDSVPEPARPVLRRPAITESHADAIQTA